MRKRWRCCTTRRGRGCAARRRSGATPTSALVEAEPAQRHLAVWRGVAVGEADAIGNTAPSVLVGPQYFSGFRLSSPPSPHRGRSRAPRQRLWTRDSDRQAVSPRLPPGSSIVSESICCGNLNPASSCLPLAASSRRELAAPETRAGMAHHLRADARDVARRAQRSHDRQRHDHHRRRGEQPTPPRPPRPPSIGGGTGPASECLIQKFTRKHNTLRCAW